MAETLSFLTMSLYFGGTLLFLAFLLHRSEVLVKVAVSVAGAGFFAHTAALVMAIIATGQVPIMTFRDAMSFSPGFGSSFFSRWLKTRVTGIRGVYFALSLSFLVSATLAPAEAGNIAPVFQTVWVHVTLSILGTIGFAIAFVAGLMYLMQERLLKSKQFNVLYYKLPPLDFLDALNQRSILFGFPLLTLGILTGAVSAQLTVDPI